MRSHRIGLVQRWLGTALLPAFAMGGCLVTPSPDEEAATELACPPDEPDCDRLDEPCAFDEEEASLMGPGSGTTGLAEKAAGGKYRTWPNGRVPYKIDSSVGTTTKGLLMQAMNEWETKTGGAVRFEKATSTDGIYMVVSGGSPITNHVGYYAGSITKVKLRNPEYVTVIRHELGHVLGLHHEQRRSDRGDYIQVKTANIVDSTLCKNQFNVCTDCEPIKTYNIGSIMHYRTSDLSKCQTAPVLLKKDGTAIKHTWVITAADVAVIHTLYGAPAAAGGTGGTGGTGGSVPSDAGSTGGSGGVAGSAGASAGAAGDDGIDTPDEETGGTSGAAGSAASTGGASTGVGASAGSTPKDDAGGTTEESSGCSTRKAPRDRSDWLFAALALASFGLLRRQRIARR